MAHYIWVLALIVQFQAQHIAQAVPVTNHYQAEQTRPVNDNTPTGASAGQQDTPDEGAIPSWLRCTKLTGITKRLEALPGMGWDSLSNKKMGAISTFTYDMCQTTPDGEYLVPDSFITAPLKQSKVARYAEIFNDFSDYRSGTSQSMELDVTYKKISGSFSDDYQTNKANQVYSNSATLRAEIRHNVYFVEVKPNTMLSQAFRDRIKSIAAKLHENRLRAADYEMDLVIRDFGTHAVRSVVAGGVFMEESQFHLDGVSSSQSSSTDIKASASFTFYAKVGLHFSYGTSQSTIDNYQKNVTQSTIRTFGGPVYNGNLTALAWQAGLTNALVAIDREGDPIEFVITPLALPELPEPTVRKIAEGIAAASKRYVKFNTHTGCTDLLSSNFNFKANVGDQSMCKLAPTNYTFGGAFQTCNYTSDTQGRDVCETLRQKNPLSGGYSCPDGYESVLLHTGQKVLTWQGKSCHPVRYSCGFLSLMHCSRQVCHTKYMSASPTYKLSWCVKLGKATPKTGYMFGGIYSAQRANPFTNTDGCPRFFYPVSMGSSLHICVSEDYENGIGSSVPFGGLLSCTMGNPLALASASNGRAKTLDEVGFGALTGSKNFPRHCPHGYARHLAGVDDSCDIEYCIQSHAFDKLSRLLLQRPPYGQPYPDPDNDTVVVMGVGAPGGQTWVRNYTTDTWEAQSFMSGVSRDLESEISDVKTTSSGAMIGVGVLSAVCGLLSVVLVSLYTSRVRSAAAGAAYRPLPVTRSAPSVSVDRPSAIAKASQPINIDSPQVPRPGYSTCD